MSFFKKLFHKKNEIPATNKENIEDESNSNAGIKSEKEVPISGLETPVEEVKKAKDGYVSLGRSIFPVIKNINDNGIKLTENSNPLVTTHIAEGITVCYVIDIGDKLERISESHLKQFNLDKEMVHNTAMRNLIDKVNKDCKIRIHDYSASNSEIKPFYEVEFDRNYNPSMMLLSDFWETTAKEVTNSDLIAVSIPATNIIFFSDFKLMESFRTMRPVAAQLFDASLEDRLQLTKDTYVRKSGEWVRFLDTEDQFIELMGY